MPNSSSEAPGRKPEVATSDVKANIAVSPEQQLILAERRREIAIMRYKLNVRRGAAWSKGPEPSK